MSDVICALCETAGCPWRSDTVLGCSHYTPKSETNYERLFGTPERAARIVTDMCDLADKCPGCPFFNTPDGVCGDYYALLEWLRGDA